MAKDRDWTTAQYIGCIILFVVLVIYIYSSGYQDGYASVDPGYQIEQIPTHEACLGCEPQLKHDCSGSH